MQFNPKEYAESRKASLPAAGSVVKVQIVKECGDKLGTEIRESSTGHQMMVVCAKILSPAGKGLHLFQYVVLDNEWTQKNIGRILTAVGIPVTKPVDFVPKLIIGKVALVKVKHEVYEGEPQAKINYWLPHAALTATEGEDTKPRHEGSSEPSDATEPTDGTELVNDSSINKDDDLPF